MLCVWGGDDALPVIVGVIILPLQLRLFLQPALPILLALGKPPRVTLQVPHAAAVAVDGPPLCLCKLLLAAALLPQKSVRLVAVAGRMRPAVAGVDCALPRFTTATAATAIVAPTPLLITAFAGTCPLCRLKLGSLLGGGCLAKGPDLLRDHLHHEARIMSASPERSRRGQEKQEVPRHGQMDQRPDSCDQGVIR